jgi:NAD(P)-dependent dehydrogenase (short-subunit alcohol dehydrogenase family)
MTSPVVSNAMYVILGASGNTGSIIADFLLSKGEKVRVVGRDVGRLQRFVRKGAEAFPADMTDAAALTKAFTGARAAYAILPPLHSREEQERQSDAIATGVRESGLRHAVHLSSYCAQVPQGTGPVTGLHSSEEKLNAIRDLNVLHVFHGEQSGGDRHDSRDGPVRACAAAGPMIATRDVGDYAAQRLLDLDFSGKEAREVLGERDLSMTEVTAAIAHGIGKPDLRYEQFSYDQVRQALVQMGFSPKKAAVYIEMFEAINAGLLVAQEPRSPKNSTPTSFERFVRDIFVPAYHTKAHSA